MTPLHDWITISEDDLMHLIRCAYFRDSWMEDNVNLLVFSQLTPESQAEIREWEERKP